MREQSHRKEGNSLDRGSGYSLHKEKALRKVELALNK